jgi:Leucine-rich repeat (LRR) protein
MNAILTVYSQKSLSEANSCKLLTHSYLVWDLVCEGNQIKNLTELLRNQYSSSLYNIRSFILNGTSVELLDLNVFQFNVLNMYIYITNNPNLVKIVNYFTNVAYPVKILEITNSPQLNDSENIFSIANALRVSDQIVFKNLGIKEIPDFVFDSNRDLFSITITDNPIKRIGKSPFRELSNLQTLSLKNNIISYIDDNGLSFDLGNKHRYLQVILDNNLLTNKSFAENWTNNKRETGSITAINFSFDNNRIISLPESIFRYVLLDSNVNYLSFDGNNIVCDCKMGYIIKMIKSYKEVELKIKNVFCSNIRMLNVMELVAQNYAFKLQC